jgi:hypothetical protein
MHSDMKNEKSGGEIARNREQKSKELIKVK